MREIKMFLASSTDGEFKEERDKFLASIMDYSRKHYESYGIILNPIISDGQGYGTDGNGAQDRYDQLIKASRLVIVLAGRKVGPYTLREYELAIETCNKRREEAISSGVPEKEAIGTPRVCAFFKAAEEAEKSVKDFKERVKKDGIYSPNKCFSEAETFIKWIRDEVDNCLKSESADIKAKEKFNWVRKGFILCLVLLLSIIGTGCFLYQKYMPSTEQIRIYAADTASVSEIIYDLNEVGKAYIKDAKEIPKGSNEHLDDEIEKVAISPGIPGTIKVDYEPKNLLITKTEIESSISGAIKIETVPLSENIKIKVSELWEEGDGRDLIVYLTSGKAKSNRLYVTIQPFSIVSEEEREKMGWK